MFKRQKNNAAGQFAIDSGGFRTRFYSPAAGFLLDQPSIAVVDMDHRIGGSKAVDKFGDDAESVIAHGLDGMRAIRPVQSDQHNDLALSAKMLGYFLRQTTRSRLTSSSAEIVLMLPHDCSARTSTQLINACATTGARNVRTIDSALASFYATGLNQSEPCIIIDFGATESRMFAIVDGEVVQHRSLSCGGDVLDKAIADGLLERFSLYVPIQTAREIKHSVAAATPQSLVRCTRSSCQVNCLSVKTNTTTTFRVGSETINQILQPTLKKLADSINSALSNIDTSITDAAYQTGIQICGGGALLPRLDQLVMVATDLPVEVARRPLNSNIRGAASILVDAQIDSQQADLAALS